MKIILLGGSNCTRGSIGRGINEFLGSDPNNIFLNFATWGTPSLENLCNILLKKDQFEDADLIITESNLNDYHRTKATRLPICLEHIIQEIYLFYLELFKLNKKVLVIIISSPKDNPKALAISNIHRYCVNKFGFNCLDLDKYMAFNVSSYFKKNIKIQTFSSDKNHELKGIYAHIIYNALLNNQKLVKPFLIKDVDFYDINYQILTANDIKNKDFNIIEKTYGYIGNTYKDFLIKLSNKPLILKLNKNYDLVAFSTYVELNNPKIKQNYFNSIAFYNRSTKKYAIKFVLYGKQFEYVVDPLFQNNKEKTEFVELTENYNNLPTTERSFHEILNNPVKDNTNNSIVHFCYAILIEGYKNNTNYQYNKDLVEIKNYIEKNSNEYLSISELLNINYIIPDLNILLDIFLLSMPSEICLISEIIKIKKEKDQVIEEYKEKLDSIQKEQLIKENQEKLIHVQSEKLIKENIKLKYKLNNLLLKTKTFRLVLKFIKTPKKYLLDSKYKILKNIGKFI